MHDRPTLFVRVTDTDGVNGYGEVWCNFPSVAAEHRQRLVQEVAGPSLIQLAPMEYGSVFGALMARLHILAIQSGEWGPLRQVSAGLDAAVHDLAARRAGLPLYKYLNDKSEGRLKAYASGIGPENPAAVAAQASRDGHVAFKVKVGFGQETDQATIEAIRKQIGADAELMVDANQRWTLAEAIGRIAPFAEAGIRWVEEPLAADRPLEEWLSLRENSLIDLAAGENIGTTAGYDRLLETGAVRYVQPDVAKWGGVSQCFELALTVKARGLTYCPHFLGGGVGLLASAHLLAAQGGEGMLEIDTNSNPFREEIAGPLLKLDAGRIRLSDEPGIGAMPDHLFA